MPSSTEQAQTHPGETTAGSPPAAESIRVRGDALAGKVKDLLHEATVRRIVVKNAHGVPLIEIPVTVGVAAVAVAPVMTAVAAMAALASDWDIEIHHHDAAGAGV